MLQTNSNQFIEAYYATATIGATFVPLNYRAKPPEVEYMVTAADVKVLFIGDRYLALLEELKPKFTMIQHYVCMDSKQPNMHYHEDLIATGSPDIEDADVDEEDLSILMYTSGTTSLPKGVMLSYGGFTNYVVGTVEMADGTPRRDFALVCPRCTNRGRDEHHDRHLVRPQKSHSAHLTPRMAGRVQADRTLTQCVRPCSSS